MLPQADILQTISEIAVAIAGFAALAGAFGGTRLEPRESAAASHALRLVVTSGLFVLISALIPLAVSEYGAATSITWKLSSGLVLAINVFGLVRALAKGRDVSLRLNDRDLRLIAYPLEVACFGLLLAIIFGLFEELASAFYVTLLVIRFAQVALMFLRFLEIAFPRTST